MGRKLLKAEYKTVAQPLCFECNRHIQGDYVEIKVESNTDSVPPFTIWVHTGCLPKDFSLSGYEMIQEKPYLDNSWILIKRLCK